MAQLLYLQGKNPQYPGSWVSLRVSMDVVVRRKKSHICWELNPGHAAYSTVTILTELLQLLFSDRSLSLTTNVHKKQTHSNLKASGQLQWEANDK
jgi:hypothetical protein